MPLPALSVILEFDDLEGPEFGPDCRVLAIAGERHVGQDQATERVDGVLRGAREGHRAQFDVRAVLDPEDRVANVRIRPVRLDRRGVGRRPADREVLQDVHAFGAEGARADLDGVAVGGHGDRPIRRRARLRDVEAGVAGIGARLAHVQGLRVRGRRVGRRRERVFDAPEVGGQLAPRHEIGRAIAPLPAAGHDPGRRDTVDVALVRHPVVVTEVVVAGTGRQGDRAHEERCHLVTAHPVPGAEERRRTAFGDPGEGEPVDVSLVRGAVVVGEGVDVGALGDIEHPNKERGHLAARHE